MNSETDVPAMMVVSNVEQLESIAQDIEHLQSTAILCIAAHAAKAHELFRYNRDEGGFAGWMKDRLGYSRSSAYRLLDVHRRFGGGESVPRLRQSGDIWRVGGFGTLSVSAIYLLAAPSTPQEAVDQVAARIEAGERMSCATVEEAIAKAKGEPAPTTKNSTDQHDAEGAGNDGAGNDGAGDSGAGDDGAGDDHTDGGDQTASDENAAGAPAPIEPPPDPAATGAPVETTKSKAEPSLVESWRESSPEDRDAIRDLVLGDYFATADGRNILSRIRGTKRDVVIRDLLDALTVDGMLKTASRDFKQLLSNKVPTNPSAWLVEKDAGTIAAAITEKVGPAKASVIADKLKLKPKTMSMEKTVDAHGKPVHALEQRGNRSRL
jgi:hypothetical protein